VSLPGGIIQHIDSKDTWRPTIIGVLSAFYIEQIQNIKKYQPKKKYK